MRILTTELPQIRLCAHGPFQQCAPQQLQTHSPLRIDKSIPRAVCVSWASVRALHHSINLFVRVRAQAPSCAVISTAADAPLCPGASSLPRPPSSPSLLSRCTTLSMCRRPTQQPDSCILLCLGGTPLEDCLGALAHLRSLPVAAPHHPPSAPCISSRATVLPGPLACPHPDIDVVLRVARQFPAARAFVSTARPSFDPVFHAHLDPPASTATATVTATSYPSRCLAQTRRREILSPACSSPTLACRGT